MDRFPIGSMADFDAVNSWLDLGQENKDIFVIVHYYSLFSSDFKKHSILLCSFKCVKDIVLFFHTRKIYVLL